MEARVQERLHELSLARGRLFARLFTAAGPSATCWLESNVLFHTMLFFTTLMVVVAVFAQIRGITLFTFHPLFMGIGSLCFFGQGLVAYQNSSLLELFGPIMQTHNKRIKVRVIHQSLQLMGSGFIGMGLLFILANKAYEKKSILPHTLHSLFGTLVIFLIAVQGVSGLQKMNQLESKSATKIRRWHGDSGLLLWDLLCATLLLGMLEFLNLTLTNVFVELCVVGCWFLVHAQLRRKGDSSGEDREDRAETVEPVEMPPDASL